MIGQSMRTRHTIDKVWNIDSIVKYTYLCVQMINILFMAYLPNYNDG